MKQKMDSNHWDFFWEGSSGKITPERLSERLWDASKNPALTLLFHQLKKGSFASKRLLEVGGGLGTSAQLFALLGLQTVVSDISKTSLSRSRHCFEMTGLHHSNFEKWNLLDETPKQLREQFDATISLGVGEHFENKNRERYFEAIWEPLRPGGVAVFTIPNAYCWPYRIVKKFRELTGTWTIGLEIPYAISEIKKICIKKGFPEPIIFGPTSITTDTFEYGLGFLYASKLLFPKIIQNTIRRKRRKIQFFEENNVKNPLTKLSSEKGRKKLFENLQKPVDLSKNFPTSSILIVMLKKEE